jgi:hypothetical protein
MTVPFWAAASIITGLSLGYISSMLSYTILGEVNGKLPESERFSLFFVNAKFWKILRLHKQYYPKSRKPAATLALLFTGFALVAAPLIFG